MKFCARVRAEQHDVNRDNEVFIRSNRKRGSRKSVSGQLVLSPVHLQHVLATRSQLTHDYGGKCGGMNLSNVQNQLAL